MKIRLAGELQVDSIVDGEGLRTVIWTQGCNHNCLGCHNETTHSLTDGFLMDIEDIKKGISKVKYHDGITLSGGEPFLQSEPCKEIAMYVKSLGMTVWAYSGFTYEQILNNEKYYELLKYVDVLVDGRFILSERSLDLKFRGSRNQRVINVKKSLELNMIVPYYDESINQKLFQQEALKQCEFLAEEEIFI